MYALAAAYFVFVGGGRFWAARHHQHIGGVHDPYASAIFFAALTMFALVLLSAAGGHIGAFTSLADARFLIGSHLRERNVVVWLQLRSSWRLVARALFLIIFYTVLYSTAGSFSGMAFSMMAFAAFSASFAIPTMRVQQRFGNRTGYALPIAAGGLGLTGLGALSIGSVFPQQAHIGAAIVHLGFGRLVQSMFAGAWLPIAILFGLTLVMGATAYWGAEDLYPELYRGSSRAIDIVRRSRRNPFAFQRGGSVPKTAISERVAASAGLRGAWSLLWKDAVAFKRSRTLRPLFFAGAILSLIGGMGAGIAAHRTHDPVAVSIAIGGSIGNLLVIFTSMYSSMSLAADIGKPLWWLNADPLRSRLYVRILATSWRMALCVALALIAWAFFIPSVLFGLAAIPAAACIVVFLRSIGLALYSLFPAAVDQRGPVAMLRIFALYLLLGPPAAAGFLAGAALHAPSAGLAAGIVFALIEALLLVEFAAYRIGRSGIAFAQAEAT